MAYKDKPCNYSRTWNNYKVMIDRLIRQEIEDSLNTEAAVVLIGPRQVGKTTLAIEVGEKRDALYLDLEDPATLAVLSDPRLYLEQFADRLVILDEIHQAPEIFQALRGIIDRGRRTGNGEGRFLILGSASIQLLRQTGESLAGRVAYIELTPLNALEIEDSHEAREQLWLRGGFPRSFLANNDRMSLTIRRNLIRTYLTRDIPEFGPSIPATTMDRLWTMLAHRQGSILNGADLARSLEISTQSVHRYIDLLVDMFLVRRLLPYHANVGKRLVKSPKMYIRDSGLTHALLEISNPEQLARHPVYGLSWEGFVLENLISVLPFGAHPFFYRTHAGAEVDLLIEFADGLRWAIEVKRSLVAKITRGFYIAREDLAPVRSFVVHAREERSFIAEGIEVIGVRGLMDELYEQRQL